MIYPAPKPKPGRGKARTPHPLTRSKRMKQRGKRTKKSGGHLFPKRRSPEYREWIRGFACLLRGMDPSHRCPLGIFGSECAHVKSRGAGGDDVGNCVPLCNFHHAQQHRLGIRSFERRHGFTKPLAWIAADLATMYPYRSHRQAERGGLPQ